MPMPPLPTNSLPLSHSRTPSPNQKCIYDLGRGLAARVERDREGRETVGERGTFSIPGGVASLGGGGNRDRGGDRGGPKVEVIIKIYIYIY